MPSTSFASNAAASASTSRRSAGKSGLGGASSWGRFSSVARARLSALVTESSDVSSISATSAARNPSTSRDQHGPLARRQELERRNEGQEMASLVS